jgi:hypothetical protein
MDPRPDNPPPIVNPEDKDLRYGTPRSYGMGPGSGVAFLVGAILIIFAIVAFGTWSGGNGPHGTATTTNEQPINPPPATKTQPSPG